MNIYQIIKKINRKINKYFIWKVFVVAFLAGFVVILFLNIFIFQKLESELFFKEETTITEPLKIKQELLEKIISIKEKKKENFDNILFSL